MTHFLQALFNQARLPCGLNSCIIFYFIILSMTQAHATYWGKREKHIPFATIPWSHLLAIHTCFCDTFSTSPIQPSLTSLWTRFIYYILFIFLSMAQAHVTIWENWGSVVWRVWVSFFWTFCMSLYPCVLPSGQGTLVAPQAHGGGLVSKISTPK